VAVQKFPALAVPKLLAVVVREFSVLSVAEPSLPAVQESFVLDVAKLWVSVVRQAWKAGHPLSEIAGCSCLAAQQFSDWVTQRALLVLVLAVVGLQ